jgi:hypothetical protein
MNQDQDDEDLEDEDTDEDFDYEDLPDLPTEAGKATEKGFEPDNDWLRSADRRYQHAAMREWFFSHFQDPANDTPYNSGEGGYLYIRGGPYDAAEALYSRFGDFLEDSDAVIQGVVEDVESEGVDEWAPIDYGDDYYDERLALEIESDTAPLRRFRERLAQHRGLLALQGDGDTKRVARQLVFAAGIGALEAFLYEVVHFWIDSDDKALEAFVTRLPKFREEKLPLSDIFKQMAGLRARAKGHLQATVWHRWDHVAQIYRASLGVEIPDTKALDDALLKRHDIVHRSGHDKDGNAVQVTDDEVNALSATVEAFAAELERRIGKKDEGTQ